LQPDSNTFVFRYIAIRLLEIDIFLDRRCVDQSTKQRQLTVLLNRTAETIASFIRPLTVARKDVEVNPIAWVGKLTAQQEENFAKPGQTKARDPDLFDQAANSGRLYIEQLHLHPVRLGLTFTQEWMDLSASTDTFLLFQFIRGMVRTSLNLHSQWTNFDFDQGIHRQCTAHIHVFCGRPRF
jgi:hypothetical protein